MESHKIHVPNNQPVYLLHISCIITMDDPWVNPRFSIVFSTIYIYILYIYIYIYINPLLRSRRFPHAAFTSTCRRLKDGKSWNLHAALSWRKIKRCQLKSNVENKKNTLTHYIYLYIYIQYNVYIYIYIYIQ